MITCKEDLINTYIENDQGELRDLYIKKAIELGVKTCDRGRFEYLLDKVTIGVIDWGTGAQLEWNNSEFRDAKYLTLSDLKPRTKTVYEKVIESPKEIFQAMLNGDEFYLFKNELLNFDGNQFWCHKEEGKHRITFIEDENEIYRKVEKEIDWRDEVSDFVINSKITYSCNGHRHIVAMDDYTDEQFLEMCRVALRATGELE